VLPHLLVPDLRAALARTAGHVVVTMNLAPQAGETEGLGPVEHLDVLRRIAPELRVDVVLADPHAVPDLGALEDAAAALGGRLVVADVRDEAAPATHHPEKLALAYAAVMNST
jgi:2-phospho-L-lactate transferase/gluconeogenesis factor (CofD/UPF0052 family)